MKKKKLPEMVLRIFSSVVYICIIILLVACDNKIISTIIAGIASLIAVWEYFNCVNLNKSPYIILGFILSVLTTISILVFKTDSFTYFSTAFIIVFAITTIVGLFISKRYSFNDIALSIFGYIYTIFLILFMTRIFFFENGNIKITLLLTIVLATDTFAFLIGRKFGKHKLSKISPNKSIEGSVSGVIASVIFTLIYTVLVNRYFHFNLNYLIMIAIAIGLSIISQLGDLVASFIKRAYKKKDFGNLLPGQGGILDRIDSLIFSAPFAYIIIMLIM